MTDPLPSLDLRLTPDWVKESETGNRYSDYEGDDHGDRQHRGRRDRRDDRPRRPGPSSDRPRQDRPDRRPAPNARPSGASPGRAPSAPRTQPSNRASEPGGNRTFRSDRPRFERQDTENAHPEVEPAPVQIDFLPEERAFSKIIQQIKQGHIAYPLFGLARMFLERPERHRIRVRSLDNHTLIYQFGDDGPVAMEATALERIAFNAKKEEFYETRIVEKEPVKGNFTSVARCTLTGKLLGPTNYHAFQPALRGLYEQRFSRRMSFEDYRRSIEISNDPQLVEQWKEEARTTVKFQTKDPESPVTLDTPAAVEQHFRANYLSSVIKGCLATEISGDASRHLPDRGIVAAIRKARDRENRFPAQIAGALRHGLNQAGLHVFKHKKRILYISTVRPQLFDSSQGTVSTGLAAILSTIRSYPKISRKQLAEKVLAKVINEKAEDESNAAYQQARTALASDLIWLAKAGHVIEFADGTLDLPLPPRSAETAKSTSTTTSAAHNEGGGAEDSSADEELATDLESEETPAVADSSVGSATVEQENLGDAGDVPAELEISSEPAKAEADPASESHEEVPAAPEELVET
jgi:hypothetical protein